MKSKRRDWPWWVTKISEWWNPPRSSKCDEPLTDYERRRIVPRRGILKGTGILLCPDCQATLREGPGGGMSLNMACGGCGSEFNLTLWGDKVIFADRISDAGPRELGERAGLYRGSV